MAKMQRQSGFSSNEKINENTISDPIRRMYRAGAQLMSGVAAAVADGYRTYADTLAREDVARPDFDNGFIAGMVNGWVAALEQAPDILTGSFDTLRNATSSKPVHKGEFSEGRKSESSLAKLHKRARTTKAAA